MSLWRLITREIIYRKLNFALALLSVLVAVGCLVAELTLLRRHDLQTARIIAQKEEETAEMMADVQRRTDARMDALEQKTAAQSKALADETRKAMRHLGFNVLILPKDQNLSDLYAEDFASKYMPEDYADRLAKSSVATINHLLPSLQQRVRWPEQKDRTVILMGVRGEVPILHADPKKPLLQPVPTDRIVVGYELHRALGLKVGDKLTVLGKEFTVHQLHESRGNKDDITLWLSLKEAQQLLDRKGQINGILALECNCEANRLDKVREEIAAILPDTQVVEFHSQALARAEQRSLVERQNAEALKQAAAHVQREREEAAALAAKVVADEKAGRARLREQHEAFANFLIPVVLAGCVVWVGVLAFGNVRERRGEIGILRALGLRSGQVFALFLVKAVLLGLVGAAAGYLIGMIVVAPGELAVLFDPALLLGVLAAAPLLCALASWLPASLAARQDPAVVLRAKSEFV